MHNWSPEFIEGRRQLVTTRKTSLASRPPPFDPHSGRDHSVGRSHGSALSKRGAHDLVVGERGGFLEVGRAQDRASDEALAPKADNPNRFGIDSLIP